MVIIVVVSVHMVMVVAVAVPLDVSICLHAFGIVGCGSFSGVKSCEREGA